jgi:phosphocarrier protein HPr
LATVQREVKIVNKYGLHARPAMQFVETANRFACKIEVSNASLSVDAKSIMSVMRLAATQGTVLQVVADGEDAEPAADALAKLVESGFGED